MKVLLFVPGVWCYTVPEMLPPFSSSTLPWIPPSLHCRLGCLYPSCSRKGRCCLSVRKAFSACHAVAPQRPGSKRIGNVITTVFISKRTAGSLLLSIWKDPDGYSWSSLPCEQPCLKLLVQLPLNLFPPPFFLLWWLPLLYAKMSYILFLFLPKKGRSLLFSVWPCLAGQLVVI